MFSLNDKKKRFLLYQVLVAMLVAVALLSSSGLLISVVLVILSATFIPVEKINNMFLLFLVVYSGTLLGLISAGLLVAYWR